MAPVARYHHTNHHNHFNYHNHFNFHYTAQSLGEGSSSVYAPDQRYGSLRL